MEAVEIAIPTSFCQKDYACPQKKSNPHTSVDIPKQLQEWEFGKSADAGAAKT
jgi:hypothetical protein